MESVFLLMWAADVVYGLKGTVWTGFAFYLASLLFSSLVSIHDDNSKAMNALLGKWWVVALAVMLAVLTPSKETLYLAAAGRTAQLGASAVVESQLGKKTVDALESVLDRVIREAGDKK